MASLINMSRAAYQGTSLTEYTNTFVQSLNKQTIDTKVKTHQQQFQTVSIESKWIITNTYYMLIIARGK